MKRALPSGHNDLRVLLGRIESDTVMWAKGYEEITPYRLDQLLRLLQKAIPLADDDRKTLQNRMHQLEGIQSDLLRSEPVDGPQTQQLAQQIIEDLREIRHKRTSVLQPVAVEEVVGATVIHFHHSLSTVGQVVRFRPASRDRRAFGFIGEVVIRPCDDQQAMKGLFQEIYPLRDFSFLFDLYRWPEDFPVQTFQEPGRPMDLITIQWASHQANDDDEDEDGEEHTFPRITTIVQEIGDYLKGVQVRKTIREGDGDRRIGMPVYSLRQNQGGYLESIQIHGDGSERWTAIGDNGKKMSDESDLFWLEVQGYHQLFPTRALDQEDIYQHLREALALHEEQVELTESAELEDHDEILQHHHQLDRVLKFLNGDLADENQVAIATVYHQMIWSSTSFNEAQREEVARQTATEIDLLRQNKEQN